MGTIITLFKQKGGTGSTTVAALLYEVYKAKGVKKIALIDADPQSSLLTIANKLPVLGLEVGKLSDFSKWANTYDLLIVDTMPSIDPKVNKAMTKILPYSDLIILPIRPSVTDALSLQPTIDTITAIQQQHKIKASILINQISTNSPYNGKVVEIIKDYGLPIFTSMLHSRVAFSRFFLNGGIYKEGNKKAIQEIEHLANEAYTLLSI